MIVDTMPMVACTVGTAREKEDLIEQCAAYMLKRPHGEYNDYDVTERIVRPYVELCEDVGLHPAMVIAQMIHETGNLTSWWSQRPRRNPAGIGVTGRTMVATPKTGVWQQKDGQWLEGVAFKDWKTEAVPAHVGRLLAYALRDDQANPTQLRLIQTALAWRQLPSTYRGVGQTWRSLQGRWAVPGVGYSSKLASIANTMLGLV